MRYPAREFMLLSYGDDLAIEHSSAARSMFSIFSPLITGAGMSRDSKSVSRWMVDVGSGGRGGGMMACGIGSSVTGRRADVIVVDDPFKNWEEANSEVAREKVWDAYRSVIRSRLRPKGCIVVIQTRWHKDDLTGRLLDHEGGMKWEHVKLPARALENDLLGRDIGTPLWPEMYDDAELTEVEGDIGPVFWACEFQQEPEEPKGRFFKSDWFRYFHTDGDYFVLGADVGDIRYHKDECVIVQTIDPASTEESRNDFFCQCAWVLCPSGEIGLLAVQREHIATTEHIDDIISFNEKYSAAWICVSKRAAGLNLFQQLDDMGFALEEIVEDVSKLSRSLVIMRKYRRGEVYHLRDAPWIFAIESELKSFPGGKNDDFVDNASAIGIQSSQIGLCGSEAVEAFGQSRKGSSYGLESVFIR